MASPMSPCVRLPPCVLWFALALAAFAGCERSAPQRAAAAADAGPAARAHVPEPALDAGGAAPDAARDAALDPLAAQRARGEYLVQHVAACNECHTPRLPSGDFDTSKLLAGVENLIDVEPGDPERGLVHSRNLTPDPETGLGDWSDAQIKRAFQQGVDDQGKTLHWMMPYWIFHNMKADDADAIVAYLRSLPPVVHELPENQPSAAADQSPYALPSAEIPATTLSPGDPDYDSAQRGRYLASAVAPCMLCHTATLASDSSVPIDEARIFAGERKLVPVRLGTPAPADPPLIDSFNLTPDQNGISGWSAQDVATTLRQGVSPDSLPVCDPMPSYMGGSFTGMSENDALDLGHYFTSIAPKTSRPIAKCCSACHGMQGTDGGVP